MDDRHITAPMTTSTTVARGFRAVPAWFAVLYSLPGELALIVAAWTPYLAGHLAREGYGTVACWAVVAGAAIVQAVSIRSRRRILRLARFGVLLPTSTRIFEVDSDDGDLEQHISVEFTWHGETVETSTQTRKGPAPRVQVLGDQESDWIMLLHPDDWPHKVFAAANDPLIGGIDGDHFVAPKGHLLFPACSLVLAVAVLVTTVRLF